MEYLLHFIPWENPKAWQISLFFLPVLVNLWAIQHVVFHNFPGKYERIIWAYATIFLPVIGGLVYIFFGRKRAIKPQT